MPAHRFCQGVLAHAASAEVGYPGQHAEVRIGQAGGGGDASRDRSADGVRREFPGMPERRLLGVQQFMHPATVTGLVLTRQHEMPHTVVMTTAHLSRPAARVALVTGANKGIGKAIAAGLAEQGFTVYLGSRHAGRGEAAAAELAKSGDVRAVTLDVTSDGDVASAVSRVDAEAGHLDVLVNNAGTHPLSNRTLDHPPAPAE